MQLLMLPGNHPSVLEWMEEVRHALVDIFDTFIIVEYLHWAKNEKMISFEQEASRLSEFVGDKEFAIFGKSAGTMLTLMGVKTAQLDPTLCIFVGTPVKAARQLGFDIEALFKGFKCPTLFIQNENDPAGSCAELAHFLSEHMAAKYEIASLQGNTHDYDDLSDFKVYIEDFMQSLPK